MCWNKDRCRKKKRKLDRKRLSRYNNVDILYPYVWTFRRSFPAEEGGRGLRALTYDE